MIVHKFPHYVKFDMLVVMMESTVMAKSLVHISCLENVWGFFFMIMSPYVPLSQLSRVPSGEKELPQLI